MALAADQKSKYYAVSNKFGPLLAYQLDSINRPYLITKLEQKLLQLTKTNDYSILLYTSPECLTYQPWQYLMVKLLNKGVLKLLYVDGIHLFVMSGLTFHFFCNLKNTFFKNRIDKRHYGGNISPFELPCYLQIHLLLMTATFNTALLSLLKRMTGLQIPQENYLLSGRAKMARMDISIDINFTNQNTQMIKTMQTETLDHNLTKNVLFTQMQRRI